MCNYINVCVHVFVCVIGVHDLQPTVVNEDNGEDVGHWGKEDYF